MECNTIFSQNSPENHLPTDVFRLWQNAACGAQKIREETTTTTVWRRHHLWWFLQAFFARHTLHSATTWRHQWEDDFWTMLWENRTAFLARGRRPELTDHRKRQFTGRITNNRCLVLKVQQSSVLFQSIPSKPSTSGPSKLIKYHLKDIQWFKWDHNFQRDNSQLKFIPRNFCQGFFRLCRAQTCSFCLNTYMSKILSLRWHILDLIENNVEPIVFLR